MQNLSLVPEECNEDYLTVVLEEDSALRFRLPVTTELRRLVTSGASQPVNETEKEIDTAGADGSVENNESASAEVRTLTDGAEEADAHASGALSDAQAGEASAEAQVSAEGQAGEASSEMQAAATGSEDEPQAKERETAAAAGSSDVAGETPANAGATSGNSGEDNGPEEAGAEDSGTESMGAEEAEETEKTQEGGAENNSAANDNAAETAAAGSISTVSAVSATSAASAGETTASEQTSTEPEAPATPVIMLRPRDIQARIRGGASIQELCEETGMPESKVEPFAHPILAERNRMVQLAKQSHPVRRDGTSSLTLWEVVTTAFAARGLNIEDATWDAYRNDARLWIVVLRWTSGLSELTAEWSYRSDGMASETRPCNEMATELIDPDFGRPRSGRANSGIGGTSGEQFRVGAPDADPDFLYDEAEDEESFDDELIGDAPADGPLPGTNNWSLDIPPSTAPETHPARRSSRARGANRRSAGRMEIIGLDDRRAQWENKGAAGEAPQESGQQAPQESGQAGPDSSPNSDHADHSSHADHTDDGEQSFLEHPDENPKARRRRKAVTPHWEDVLLGVRPHNADRDNK